MKRWLELSWRRWTRFRSDSDLEEEMEAHVTLETDDYLARGASEDQARRLARIHTGSASVAIEKLRDRKLLTWAEGWMRDVSLGLRELRLNPAFSMTAILTLALGIGVNTAIFSFLYGLVLRPLPTHAAAELVQVGMVSTNDNSGVGETAMSGRMFRSLQSALTSVRDLSGWSAWPVAMDDGEGALRLFSAALVTGNAFQTVPLKPSLGRLIAPFDDDRGGAKQGWTVVLSYGLWADQFAKDRHIIGKRLRIAGTIVTVIGVTPPDFEGLWPGTNIKMYLPLHFANVLAGQDILEAPDALFFTAIGRRRPDLPATHVNAELSSLQKRVLAETIPVKDQHLPFFDGAYLHAESVATGIPTYVTHTYTRPLYLMQGLTGIVLLLCCVNFGGLLMSKVYKRQREFAIRTALGAPLSRLLRQHLTESLLLAAAGSLLGVLFAWRGCDVLLHFFRDPMMGESMHVRPDQSMLLFAAAMAVLTSLLFGVLPAWRASQANPGELIKSRSSSGEKRHIAGRLFVPAQVALSLVLVILASLLAQSVLKIRSEQTGFDTDHVTIQTSPLSLLKIDGEKRLHLYRRMVDRLREMPDVRFAAVTSKTPMTGEEVMSRFEALRASAHGQQDVQMAFNEVGEGYFQTMKTPVISGRAFTKEEQALNVCVLNRAAALLLFGHDEALGRYVRASDEKIFPPQTICRVTGIAEDAKFSDVRQGAPPTIYYPLTWQRIDERYGNLVFLINAGQKTSAVAAFRQTVAELAPTVPLVTFVTLREQMDAALGSTELITLLTNFFGVVALLLSALGLYGLLSASVAQRTDEIGIRMALGADRRDVVRMILREALMMLLSGSLLGVLLLIFAIRPVATMLHGMNAFDPFTAGLVLFTLTLVTILSALVPAWRAATINPTDALRA